MLLKKVETEEKIESLFDSSNIKAALYNKIDNQLILTFGKGNQYAYINVTPTDYARFELAESQGKIFNSLIKPKYEFVKLDVKDISKIEEEVDNLLFKEIQELEDMFLIQLNQVCNISGRIPTNALELIKSTIDKLLVANSHRDKSLN